jgi:hypothetical protein
VERVRLEELIKKREQELRIIKNTLGLGFPLVEERKMLRISFLELELADLYILRYEQPTQANLEKLSDIKELLENALYQPLSSSEIEGNTQAALDLVNKMIGAWSE